MDNLLPEHGGYRNLKSFQIAQLIYDLTVRFSEKYIDRFSRTKDQMIQAARSGVQNIAEGSQASATSKKTELKLTNVARASLEELKLDYEDFLRQKNLPLWGKDHPLSKELIQKRFNSTNEVINWIHEIHDRQPNPNQKSSNSSKLSKLSKRLTFREISANAISVYIHVACILLSKQITRLSKDFEKNGGFTEKLYRVRKERK